MAQKNPIKFLDSYTKEDLDIFFGRDKETDRLYDTVKRSKVVLLYGLSGTGKTSLIHCGLENKFKGDQRIFIYIRRTGNMNRSMDYAIRNELSSLVHPKAQTLEVLETLYYDFLKPITLVFDQFEELFISGDHDEILEFIDAIATILKSKLKVKLIFSLREEYLAHLDNFEEKIPVIYDHRYRLEKMRRQTLEEVITSIAGRSETSLESEAVPGQIIDNISDRKGNVELPYLQVYLDKLTRLAGASSNGSQFTEKMVEQAGELEDVLGDFLDEQIEEISAEIHNTELINDVLKQMITADGTKKQLTIEGFNLPDVSNNEQLFKVLAELEKSRIIKLEDGIYELSHDSLAQKVAEKRTAEELQLIEVIKFIKNAYSSFRQTGTLLDSKQLKFVQPFLTRLSLTEKELDFLDKSKRKRSTIRMLYAATSIVILLIIVFAGYYWQDRKYIGYIDTAKELFGENNYGDAKLNYQRAIDVLHFINKSEAHEGMQRCNLMIQQEPRYVEYVASGNNFFNLGVSYYDSAFRKYEMAQNTGFRPDEISDLISNKKENAMTVYYDLAKLEDESSHEDISLVLLSKAYILGSDNRIESYIDDILTRINKKDLETVISKLNGIYLTDPLRAKDIISRYQVKMETL